MKYSVAFGPLMVAAALGGCAVVAPSTDAPRQPYTQSRVSSVPADAASQPMEWDAVPAGMARVVLLRPQSDTAGTLNVFHGQRFQAKLLPGEFTVLNMCQGDTNYVVTGLDSPRQSTGGIGARLIEMREALNPGQQRFYQVSLQNSGMVNIAPVSPSALDVTNLSELKRRVINMASKCETVAPPAPKPEVVIAPPPAPAVNKITIPADLLFPFANYTMDEGRRAMLRQRTERFLAESGIKTIESVSVEGHADPVGQPQRKDLVASERAKAVARALSSDLGFPLEKMKVGSASDKMLLVRNCPAKPISKRDECNAPNRRVEIIISGRN